MNGEDFAAGDTIDWKFTSRTTAGAPIVLAGSASLAVYSSNSATENVTGITLTTNFDSVVGLNHIRITTGSDATFYAAGNVYNAVMTGGTVNAVTVTGEVVGRFTLGRYLKPETAGRLLRVGSNFAADANVTTWRGTGATASDIAIKTALAKTTDITGFNDLSAVAVATGVWGAAASGHVTAGTFGVYNDTTISSRLPTTSYTAPSTTTQIADGVLNRDMSAGADDGSPSVRTMRQALRFLRNKWDVTGTTLTVMKEDDSTASWTGTVTATASATPITAMDPA